MHSGWTFTLWRKTPPRNVWFLGKTGAARFPRLEMFCANQHANICKLYASVPWLVVRLCILVWFESPQISATLRSFFPNLLMVSLGNHTRANIQDEMIPYDSFLQQLGLTVLLCHLSISGWSPIRCRWNPAAGLEQTMRLQLIYIFGYFWGEATKQVPADSKLNQWTQVPVVIPGESNSITFSGCWHVRAGDRIFPCIGEESCFERQGGDVC